MQSNRTSGFHPIWIVVAVAGIVIAAAVMAVVALWADRTGEASLAKADLAKAKVNPRTRRSQTTDVSSGASNQAAGAHSEQNAATVSAGKNQGGHDFSPPDADAIPEGPFGDMVRLGRNVFVDTQHYAKAYVGNGLNCVNCHLDAGRKADAAPLWAAYVVYPAYRDKNHKVNSFQDRLAGCFRFSMNGKPPPADSEIMTALLSYSYWLAKGAPVGTNMKGRGYPKLAEPAQKPDAERGKLVFEKNCALCHGADGEGTKVGAGYVFPPLWGNQSFNGGAGMSKIKNAAAFIKANMPLGMGGSLTDQEAWDVAKYVDSKPRPPDPRKSGA